MYNLDQILCYNRGVNNILHNLVMSKAKRISKVIILKRIKVHEEDISNSYLASDHVHLTLYKNVNKSFFKKKKKNTCHF